ncbi:hypothetical protein HYU06_06995 [Candidatus Woesearchaeota archaeon]|nr:hypothetical protein [Candidatus Woesearchaeota archaeon]
MNLRNPILLTTLLAVAGVSGVPGGIIRLRNAFAEDAGTQDESNIETATVSRYTDYFAPELSGIGSKVIISMPRDPRPEQNIVYDVGIEGIITPNLSAANQSEFDFRIPIIEFAAAFPESMNVMGVELYVGNGEQLLKAEKIPGIDITKEMTIAALLGGFGGEQAQKLMEYAKRTFGEALLSPVDHAFDDDDPVARGQYDVTTMKIDASDYILPFRRAMIRFRVRTEDGYNSRTDLPKFWMVYGEQVRYTGLGKRDLPPKLLVSRDMKPRILEVTFPVPFALRNAGAVSGSGQQPRQNIPTITNDLSITCQQFWNTIQSVASQNPQALTSEIQSSIDRHFWPENFPYAHFIDVAKDQIIISRQREYGNTIYLKDLEVGLATRYNDFLVQVALESGLILPAGSFAPKNRLPLNAQMYFNGMEYFLRSIIHPEGISHSYSFRTSGIGLVISASEKPNPVERTYIESISEPRIIIHARSKDELANQISEESITRLVRVMASESYKESFKSNGVFNEAVFNQATTHVAKKIRAGDYNGLDILDTRFFGNDSAQKYFEFFIQLANEQTMATLTSLPNAAAYYIVSTNLQVFKQPVEVFRTSEGMRFRHLGEPLRNQVPCLALWFEKDGRLYVVK